MNEDLKTYRIRTKVGEEKPTLLNVQLNQTYDMFEILSLKINQPLVNIADCCYSDYLENDHNNDGQIDLDASDFTLIGDAVSMYEIKDKNNDIEVVVRTR